VLKEGSIKGKGTEDNTFVVKICVYKYSKRKNMYVILVWFKVKKAG